jgi:uncharacterized membrane protein YeaQ/YmgE (transglycosylase-associated protein family)
VFYTFLKSPAITGIENYRVVFVNLFTNHYLRFKIRKNFVIILTKTLTMNLKRTFGAILTILGIIGLIYAAYIFASTATNEQSVKSTAIYGVIGLIFFIAGIGLVKKTRDDSRI